MYEIGIIIAVITGLGQVVKQFIPSKAMPIVSLAFGVAAGFGFVDGSIQEQIFSGLAIGLAASGLFDVAELPLKVKKEREGSVNK